MEWHLEKTAFFARGVPCDKYSEGAFISNTITQYVTKFVKNNDERKRVVVKVTRGTEI
jgi:hypothetical protein